jgi:hypothetical protein
VAGGLSRRRLADASEQLRQVGPEVAGRRQTRDLLAACPRDEVELAAPVDAAWQAIQRGFERLATHPLAPQVVVVVLVIQAIGAPVIAVAIRFDDGVFTDFPVIGVVVGSLLSASFTARGAWQLRKGNRARAVRLFELAVLVSLLMTQVFQFAGTQFAAVFGMLLDLVLLGLLKAERDRMRRKANEVTRAKTLRLPPDPTLPPFPHDPSDPV